MSTEITKQQIRTATRELASANHAFRTKKPRRFTKPVRISAGIAMRLKKHAKAKKRTMSKVADELIEAGLPHEKCVIDQKREKKVTEPFSAKNALANL